MNTNLIASFICGATVGLREFHASYSLVSWMLGWLTRVGAQVVFYASIGGLLHSADRQVFLMVGASVIAVVAEVMLACASTSKEYSEGTLTALIATPCMLVGFLAGRSIHWPLSAAAASSCSLLMVGPWFGLQFGFLAAMAVVALVGTAAIGTYGTALLIAVVIIRYPMMRNVVGALFGAVISVTSGSVVPLSFWPPWVSTIGDLFPPTHALIGLRSVVTSGASIGALGHGCGALLVGAAWVVFVGLAVQRIVNSGRRDGSIILEK